MFGGNLIPRKNGYGIKMLDEYLQFSASKSVLGLIKISYDTGKLGDLLEALVDLCCLQNLVKEKDEEKERFNGITAGLLAEKEKDKVDKDAMLDRMSQIEAMLTPTVRR
ncbi:hypothetical protein HanXRQr2_Chr17g0807911 [Helianthus annuus]|uniref:Uncharacterized protein n=1 Tax=Helianthus annuus TaxID=4232 RepID=A0A9K3DJP1_HELAN|nr:hypothetical protein HanXRQr2_Chr17g0807911 [Helianthus annuus]KAJ0429501.1 hypothetical protein HanHA300_Chr17g0658131 [Helianthus annuus]KAJ0429511.1 hypothetical protein HanHA300_Chr17g0658231 [Helianthus annuus]KAJ0434036.1 hypothetical protein HanIR_Chr17g0876921 [Helianthus annuus]KAJ0636626.1 hypothetical protein HanOQP8_Chr17g0664171 [Helianthus annuus]